MLSRSLCIVEILSCSVHSSIRSPWQNAPHIIPSSLVSSIAYSPKNERLIGNYSVVVHDSLSHDSVLEQWMEMFAAFTPAQQIRVVSSLLHQLSLDSRFSILSQFQPNTRSPIRVPRTFVGAERLGPRQRRDREAQAWNYLKRLAAGKRSESPAQAPSEPPLQVLFETN